MVLHMVDLQYVPIPSVVGSTKLNSALQSGHCWAEGKGHLPGSTPANAAQDKVSLSCHKDSLLAWLVFFYLYAMCFVTLFPLSWSGN